MFNMLVQSMKYVISYKRVGDRLHNMLLESLQQKLE